MHIVYVIAPGGGPEAYVRTMVPWLETQGHRVSVVCTRESNHRMSAFSERAQIAYATTGTGHYYIAKAVGDYQAWPLRLRAWERARAVCREVARLDAVNPVDAIEVTEGLPIAVLRKRWPVLVRAHGSEWSVRFFCQDGDTKNDRWLIALERRQLSQANAVGAISQHLAEHISRFCHYPQELIHVIPYPVESELFRPTSEPITHRSPYLLTVGRLERRKGTDVLLRALSAVWPSHPDLSIHLFGSEGGLTKEELLAFVPESKRRQVIYHGFVEHGELADYYRHATIYIAPTLYETFGYTILEAMASGVPVVASAVGGIPELVDDNITGLLVPPRDAEALAEAIIGLLDDPVRRSQMGGCAREKAIAQYSMDKVAALNLEFYQRALQRSSFDTPRGPAR